MAYQGPEVRIGLPVLDPWHRWLIGGLFGAYVAELLLFNVGVPVYGWLPWFDTDTGLFRPWQLATRFLVQGADRAAVVSVLLSLFLLFFFLPMAERGVDRPDMGKAVAAGAVGGTALPLLLDLLGLAQGAVLGWGPLVLTLPMLFGLARPDDDVLLLVFPVKARAFVWLTLLVAVMFLLVERTLDTFQGLGVWIGVYGWWHTLGPGGRVRRQRKQAEGAENEVRRFEVIEGGRQRPQGRQDGDDWVH